MVSQDNVAITGKGGWLFLNKGSNCYYEAYLEDQIEASKIASQWSDSLGKFKELANRYNARYAAVIIPNKASILPIYYPLDIPFDATPRLRALLSIAPSPLICSISELQTAPHAPLLYRRLDTHLTEAGNLYYSRKILESFGIDESICVFPSEVVYVQHHGDLGGRYKDMAKENVARIRYRKMAGLNYQEISKPISAHTGLVYETFNIDAPVKARLAVFGNSFFDRPNGWSLAPLFCRIFERVRFHWESGVYPEYIEAFKPDYILFQTCERFLLSPPRGIPYSKQFYDQMKDPTAAMATQENGRDQDSGSDYYFSLRTGEGQAGHMFIYSYSIGDIGPNTELPLHQLAQHQDLLKNHGITLIEKDSKNITAIDASEFISNYLSEKQVLAKLQNSICPGKWDVYSYMPLQDGYIEVKIGVVLPMELRGQGFTVLCEGEKALATSYFYDPNFGRTHWFMPIECVIGAKCTFKIDGARDYLHFEISFPNGRISHLTRSYRQIPTYTDPRMLESLPDISRIQRVASKNANRNSFLNGGRSAFLSLKKIAHQHGIRLGEKPVRILDWGVGCGRVARHFLEISGVDLIGIDIDSDNITWCRENLSGSYHYVELEPPTDIRACSFDFIYSCSVLSHLTEDAADKWLAEIERLLDPDGIALLSYNGTSNAASYLSRRPSEFLLVTEDKLFDKDINTELEGYIPSETYYRASFASDRWWQEKFGKYFEMRGVELSVVSGHQHVAVLAKSHLSSPRREDAITINSYGCYFA